MKAKEKINPSSIQLRTRHCNRRFLSSFCFDSLHTRKFRCYSSQCVALICNHNQIVLHTIINAELINDRCFSEFSFRLHFTLVLLLQWMHIKRERKHFGEMNDRLHDELPAKLRLFEK